MMTIDDYARCRRQWDHVLATPTIELQQARAAFWASVWVPELLNLAQDHFLSLKETDHDS